MIITVSDFCTFEHADDNCPCQYPRVTKIPWFPPPSEPWGCHRLRSGNTVSKK